MISLYSHLTSYEKITSPAASIGSGDDDDEPPHVVSDVSPPFHAPGYVCLIDEGSTSKPTMREPSNDGSLWYLIVTSRWLFR